MGITLLLLIVVFVQTSWSSSYHMHDVFPAMLELQTLLEDSEFDTTRVKRASLPSPMDSLLSDAQSSQTYEFPPSCKIHVSPEDSKVKISIQGDDCPEKPSLNMMMKTLLPDVSLGTASSTFICPDCYFFESLEFDKSDKVAKVVAYGKETIRLMNPGYFQLDKTKLTVSFDTSDMDLELSKLNIEMEGYIHIKGHSAKMTISKPDKETKFSYSWRIASAWLKDLSGHFGVQIIELSNAEVSFSTETYLTIRLNNPEIKGIFTITTEGSDVVPVTIQLIAKADVTSTKAYQRATIYLIINKQEGLPPTGAVLAEVPQTYNVLQQLKKFITFDKLNKDLPLLRKIKRRYLISVSQEEMEVVEDETLLEMLKPYMKGDETRLIPDGVSVKIFVPVKDNMKECSPPVKLPELPDELPINILLKKRGLDFVYPDNFKTDMPSMLKCLDVSIAAELPYQLFPKTDGLIHIKEFTFGMGRNFRVACVVNGPFVLARGLLNISDIDIIVVNQMDPDSEEWAWTFTGSTTITFKTLTVSVSIEKSGGDYEVTGLIESFTLADLKEITGDTTFFKYVESFGALKDFGVKDLTIVASFGDSKVLRVSGQPILFGRNDLHLEAIIYKDEDTTAVILGIVIRQVNLHKLITDLCGKELIKAAWFSDLTAYIIISNVESEESYSVVEMSEAEITKGVLVKADFRIPEECHGDSLCEFMADKFGRDVTLSVEGQIINDDGSWSFRLAATITGAYALIPGKLTLKSVSLEIKVDGMDSSISLACEMDYENLEAKITQLTFQGAISLSLTGELSLQFTMVNMWMKPFNFQYLAIGNLNLGIGYQIGAPLPSFEFGGELWIGKIEEGEDANNDHLFKISCYFGLDPSDATNNYIYASINKLTIGSIMEAFKKESDMPQAASKSGFPEGLIVSFTSNPDGREIEALGINVQFGFYLKGAISILGFNLTAEITISDDLIQVEVQMSPLELAGGLILLRKSATDEENGPMCFVKIDDEGVVVQIEGYTRLLGSSAEVKVDVSDSGYEFNVSISLYEIIKASVYVMSSYGNMQTAAFKFKADLSVSFKQISENLKWLLDSVARDCKVAIERAKNILVWVKDKVKHAKSTVQSWKGELNAFRDRNNKRIAELERLKNEMNKDCTEQCGYMCYPFFDWNPECFKFLWWWCGCPCWNPCRWWHPNYFCIVACETEKFFGKVGASLEQFGLMVANGFSHVADFVLDLGQGVLSIGEHLIGFGDYMLDAIGKIVEVGLVLAKETVSLLLEQILEIRRMTIHGSFDSDFNICMGLDCDFTFLGLPIKTNFTLCINPHFLLALSYEITHTKHPGIGEMYDKLEHREGEYQDMQKVECDLDSQVAQGEKEMENEVRKEERRSQIPHIRSNMPPDYDPFPEWVMKRSDVIDIFERKVPWVLADSVNPNQMYRKPKKEEGDVFKRSLKMSEEDSPNPCIRLRSAIERYDEIVKGLHQFQDSTAEQKYKMELYDNFVQKRIGLVKRNIIKNGIKYNITSNEEEKAYFWHDLVKKGQEEWKMKANNILREQQQNSINQFKRNINHVLKETRKTDLDKYLAYLDAKAEDAYKRSNLSPTAKDEYNKMRGIRTILRKVFDSKEQSPLKIQQHLKTIKADMRTVKHHIKKCKQG